MKIKDRYGESYDIEDVRQKVLDILLHRLKYFEMNYDVANDAYFDKIAKIRFKISMLEIDVIDYLGGKMFTLVSEYDQEFRDIVIAANDLVDHTKYNDKLPDEILDYNYAKKIGGLYNQLTNEKIF